MAAVLAFQPLSPAAMAPVASLRTRYVQALARRLPAAAIGSPLLLAATIGMTDAYRVYPVAAPALLAWAIAIGAWRLAVARVAKGVGARRQNAWLAHFGMSTVASGATWGFAVAAWLATHGLEPNAVFVMVTLAGVVGSATTVSAPCYPVARRFVAAAVVPSICVLVAHGTDRAALGLALALGLYCAFLWVQGRQLRNEFLAAQARAYRLERRSYRLRRSREELRIQATHDGLTGVLNRSAGLSTLATALASARAARRDLTVVAIDLDHFKGVNDTYGHAGGDTVLRECARRLAASLRPNDVLARIGGEEFLVVLDGADLARGALVAERLRLAVGGKAIVVDGAALAISASFGVALASAADDTASLVARADRQLYAAKHGGRNRVVCG